MRQRSVARTARVRCVERVARNFVCPSRRPTANVAAPQDTSGKDPIAIVSVILPYAICHMPYAISSHESNENINVKCVRSSYRRTSGILDELGAPSFASSEEIEGGRGRSTLAATSCASIGSSDFRRLLRW